MNQENVPDEIWQCKDGRRIPVAEMEEEHARNALRIMIRARNKSQLKKRMADMEAKERRDRMAREAEEAARERSEQEYYRELTESEKWGDT